MKQPRVSVILNCYNGERYLRAALDSVLAQTYQDWELVFWDNQSKDKSSKILRQYKDERIKYFRSSVHTKLGEARNLAVLQSTGEWLAFIDSDDVWGKDKLRLQIKEANGNSCIGLVYSKVKIICENENKSSKQLKESLERNVSKEHHSGNIYQLLLLGNFIIFSTVLVKKSLYNSVGGINTDLSQNEDYDLLLKISRISEVACVRRELVDYRIHGNNQSHTQEALSYIENRLIFDALPQSKDVLLARKVNASKHAVFYMRNMQIHKAVKMLLFSGSVVWLVGKICSRFFKA